MWALDSSKSKWQASTTSVNPFTLHYIFTYSLCRFETEAVFLAQKRILKIFRYIILRLINISQFLPRRILFCSQDYPWQIKKKRCESEIWDWNMSDLLENSFDFAELFQTRVNHYYNYKVITQSFRQPWMYLTFCSVLRMVGTLAQVICL